MIIFGLPEWFWTFFWILLFVLTAMIFYLDYRQKQRRRLRRKLRQENELAELESRNGVSPHRFLEIYTHVFGEQPKASALKKADFPGICIIENVIQKNTVCLDPKPFSPKPGSFYPVPETRKSTWIISTAIR